MSEPQDYKHLAIETVANGWICIPQVVPGSGTVGEEERRVFETKEALLDYVQWFFTEGGRG